MIIERVRKLLNSPRNRKLVSNFLSLFLLQGANYLLPLITVPYLARILGPEQYGLFSMVSAFIIYFQIVTDYGFGLSAVKEIAISRDKKKKVDLIYSSVMVIKWALALAGLVVLLAIVMTVPFFKGNYLLYLFAFGNVIGSVLFPVWLFQGLERMKYITYFYLASKLVVTVLIFVLIRLETDLPILFILNALGSIGTGIVSLLWVRFRFGIRLVLPTMEEVKKQLSEGWHVFVSTVSIVVYNASPAFILGVMTNNAMVGYFAGAMKIKAAFDGLLVPLYQTLYPSVNNMASRSKKKAVVFIRKEMAVVGVLGLCIAAFLFFGSDLLVGLLLGKKFAQAVPLLRILAPSSFLVTFGFVLTTQTMLSFGLKKDYSKIYLITSVTGLAAATVMTYFFHAVGTAMTIVLTETLVLALTVFFLYRNKRVFPGGRLPIGARR